MKRILLLLAVLCLPSCNRSGSHHRLRDLLEPVVVVVYNTTKDDLWFVKFRLTVDLGIQLPYLPPEPANYIVTAGSGAGIFLLVPGRYDFTSTKDKCVDGTCKDNDCHVDALGVVVSDSGDGTFDVVLDG